MRLSFRLTTNLGLNSVQLKYNDGSSLLPIESSYILCRTDSEAPPLHSVNSSSLVLIFIIKGLRFFCVVTCELQKFACF